MGEFAILSAHTLMNKKKNKTSQEFIRNPSIQMNKIMDKNMKNNVLANTSLLYDYSIALKIIKQNLQKKILKIIENFSAPIELKIEIGCLEWIIQQIEEDKSGLWTGLTFIPSGYTHVC